MRPTTRCLCRWSLLHLWQINVGAHNLSLKRSTCWLWRPYMLGKNYSQRFCVIISGSHFYGCRLDTQRWCGDSDRCAVRRETQNISLLHHNLTDQLFGRRDAGSPFLKLSCWKATSPIYIVTDTHIVTTVTHTDRLVMCEHIWLPANNSVDRLS